jgi:hypothetical protein
VIRDNKKRKKENKTKKWDLYKSGLQERSNIVCHLILEVLSITME